MASSHHRDDGHNPNGGMDENNEDSLNDIDENGRSRRHRNSQCKLQDNEYRRKQQRRILRRRRLNSKTANSKNTDNNENNESAAVVENENTNENVNAAAGDDEAEDNYYDNDNYDDADADDDDVECDEDDDDEVDDFCYCDECLNVGLYIVCYIGVFVLLYFDHCIRFFILFVYISSP